MAELGGVGRQALPFSGGREVSFMKPFTRARCFAAVGNVAKGNLI